MLTSAIILITIAVLAGSLVAVLHMREGAPMPAWPLGVMHGLIGLGGLALLGLTLRGPARGAGQGTQGFGLAAAAVLAVAALVGLALLAARLRKRRVNRGLIAVHATIAVTGFVVLAAYFFAG